MMRIIIYLLLITTFFCACKVQKVYNQLKFDEKSNANILYGYSNLEGLKKEPFNLWFDFEYDSYQPDMAVLEQLNIEKLDELEIIIVMGTWCSDSQREVPRFYKMMESIGYETTKLTLINVDRTKQAKGTPTGKLKIERIPVFIFLKDGKEIGRIVESPKESLEKDMLKIIGS
jgi:hypothetical protein